METKDEILRQSIQSLYPGRKIQSSMRNYRNIERMSSPENRITSCQSQKKRKKSKRMKNYLKELKEKQSMVAASGRSPVSISNENHDKNLQGQSSPSEPSIRPAQSKTPLGVLNQVISKSDNSKKKEGSIIK